MYGVISVMGNGIRCYCDKVILSKHGYRPECYFLSVFGREGDVLALTAMFLQNQEIDLEHEEASCFMTRTSYGNYRVISKRIENGLHRILYNKDLFGESNESRILYGTSDENILDQFHKWLDATVSTPLKQEWSEMIFRWLWAEKGETVRCIGLGEGVKGCVMQTPDEAQLEGFILTQIVQEELWK